MSEDQTVEGGVNVNVTVHLVEPNLVLGPVNVTQITAVNLDENGKKMTTQRCGISNKSCRYLFTIVKPDGASMNVSAEILRNQLGATQKQVDKLYGIAYFTEHPAFATGVTTEQKAERVNNFLNS